MFANIGLFSDKTMAGGGLLSYDTLVLAASGAAVGIFYIGPNTFDPSKKIYIVFLHCKNVFDPANFFWIGPNIFAQLT